MGALLTFGMDNWALQYSDRVEVLEPASVREAVVEKIKQLNEKYEVDSNAKRQNVNYRRSLVMRIMSLNVNNFGGPYGIKPRKKDFPSWGEYREALRTFQEQGLDIARKVINTINIEKPNIILFQEFDVNAPAGKETICLLGGKGYKPIYPNKESEITGNYSITMIFVNEDLEVVPDYSPKILEYRWCIIKIEDLTIIGVHAPLENKERKPEDVQKFFDVLKAYAKENQSEKLIILGDLNCHIGEESSHKDDLIEMRRYLFDLVKDTDITYFPAKTSIDHVLVSPALQGKRVIPKEKNPLSDHAVIIVDVDV